MMGGVPRSIRVIHHMIIPTTKLPLWGCWDSGLVVVHLLLLWLLVFSYAAKGPVGQVEASEEDHGCKEL
jgi:hypothetical protein